MRIESYKRDKHEGQPRRHRTLRLLPLAAALAATGMVAIPGWLVAGEQSAQMPPTSGLLAGMAEPLTYARPTMADRDAAAATQPNGSVAVLNCNDAGAGSLREALSVAASGDTVDMSQLTCSKVTLAESLVVLQEQLEIHGPGRNQLTLDGSSIASKNGVLVHLGSSDTLTVEDLSISGGRKYRSNTASLGGCIHASGNLILRDVTVSDCKVQSQDQHAALGGAIWSNGRTYLLRSSVSGSVAEAMGTGYASGGGVYALGGFRAVYSLIDSNFAVSPSSTPSFGGGVFARGHASVSHSAISNNFADRLGGMAMADNGTNGCSVMESTISGNWATQVGGMYSRRPLTLYNSTIAENGASFSVDSADNPIAAGLQMGAVHLIAHSNIIANNWSSDIQAVNDLDGKTGVQVTGSNNLITSSGLPLPADTIGGPAGLGPLQDNGGATPTHALLLGESLAIDAGGAPPGGVFSFDQRSQGFLREVGTSIDIGAFEFDPDHIFINGFNYASQKQNKR